MDAIKERVKIIVLRSLDRVNECSILDMIEYETEVIIKEAIEDITLYLSDSASGQEVMKQSLLDHYFGN